MLQRRLFQTILLLCLPGLAFVLRAQRRDYDPPFPPAKGFRQVIVLTSHYSYGLPKTTLRTNDTSTCYMLNASGLPIVEYGYENGVRVRKLSYRYDGRDLIETRSYQMPHEGAPFNEDSLIDQCVTVRSYDLGHLIEERSRCGTSPGIRSERRFGYDASGRLAWECKVRGLNDPPSASRAPLHNDTTHYRYEGDSVCTYSSRDMGSGYCVRSSDSMFEEYLRGISPPGAFRWSRIRYNTLGWKISDEYRTHIPAVQADSIVLHADSIVHVYDRRGLKLRTRYFAAQVLRWEDRYLYRKTD